MFGPARTAKADPAPEDPYKMRVLVGPSVGEIQVCGYKSVAGGGEWECTGVTVNPGFGGKNATLDYMGNDWRRGKVNIWLWTNTGTDEQGYTCNTNGAYYGLLYSNGTGVTMEGNSGSPLFLNGGHSIELC
jgi:hypothetical protein